MTASTRAWSTRSGCARAGRIGFYWKLIDPRRRDGSGRRGVGLLALGGGWRMEGHGLRSVGTYYAYSAPAGIMTRANAGGCRSPAVRGTESSATFNCGANPQRGSWRLSLRGSVTLPSATLYQMGNRNEEGASTAVQRHISNSMSRHAATQPSSFSARQITSAAERGRPSMIQLFSALVPYDNPRCMARKPYA